MSIAQCKHAKYHPETETYSLYNEELQHVKLIARIVELKATRQLLKATLEDHTGTLTVHFTKLSSVITAEDGELMVEDTTIPQLK